MSHYPHLPDVDTNSAVFPLIVDLPSRQSQVQTDDQYLGVINGGQVRLQVANGELLVVC